MNLGVIYDYLWVFPLIGGIFSLIALLSPAAYLSESGNIFSLWMWGLVSIRVFDGIEFLENTAFSDNIFIITPSVICSIIIGVSAFVLISFGITCRKDLKAGSIVKSKWLTPAVLIIISTIGWMISIELVYLLGPSSLSFWEVINPNFGVIGMFLGAGFAIGGYAISKYGAKQRDETIYVLNRARSSSSPLVSIKSGMSVKFCPECGTKAEEEFQHFCSNCGFKLK